MSETPLSSLTVYSARPTVRINGQEYPKVTQLIIGMEIVEQEGGMSALELRLYNVASDPEGGADLAFEDGQILKFGAVIAIYAGDETAPQEIFQGMITGLEVEFSEEGQPPELLVLAEDAFQQARMTRKTEIHKQVSIADLGNALAKQLNLTPIITGFTDKIGTQVQLNESDLAFLRRILVRYDGDLQVVGKELHISPRAKVQRGTLELNLNSQLRRARVLADLSHQVTDVTVSGWNTNQGRRVKGKSQGSELGPGSGKTGTSLLNKVINSRSEHVSQVAVMTDTEAQALADAVFNARARQFVCVEGTTDGNPALRVGTNVTLSGLGPRFDNTYYVTQTCHRFSLSKGYQTDFEAECAFFNS